MTAECKACRRREAAYTDRQRVMGLGRMLHLAEGTPIHTLVGRPQGIDDIFIVSGALLYQVGLNLSSDDLDDLDFDAEYEVHDGELRKLNDG